MSDPTHTYPQHIRGEPTPRPVPAMTLRQWYAGLAMQGLVTNPNNHDDPCSTALEAVDCADALIAALQTKPSRVKDLEKFEQKLNMAVCESCSCGGKGPDDGCCQACEVWHRFKGETVKPHHLPQQP